MVRSRLLLLLLISITLCNKPKFLENYNQDFIRSLEQQDSGLINVRCFFVNKTNFYSFENLQEDDDRVEDIQGGKIYYNFCQNLKKECPDTTHKVKVPSTFIVETDKGCYRLSGPVEGSDMGKNVWEEFTTKINGVETPGLRLKMSGGEQCSPTEAYKTIYEITCNPNKGKDYVSFDFSGIDPNKCTNVIKGEAYDACSLKNSYRLESFFEKYKIIIGILVILLGVFYIVFGIKIIKPSMMILFGLMLTLVVNMFVYSIFTIEKELTVWLLLGIPFCIGCAIGLFVMRAINFAYFAAGAACGYFVGLFVYNAVGKFITWRPDIIYWVIIIICMILLGLFALWLLKLTLIISTSVIGGYLVIKGASFFIGGFPNEKVVVDLIKNKEWEQLQGILTIRAYLYLGAWVFLVLFGIIIQFRINRDKTSDDLRDVNKKKEDIDYEKVQNGEYARVN